MKNKQLTIEKIFLIGTGENANTDTLFRRLKPVTLPFARARKKGSNISEINNETGVSRPTVRKIVKQYDANLKWRLTRTRNENGVRRFVINTWHRRARKDSGVVDRLATGVMHYEVENLLRSFIKRDTVDEIMYNFARDPPGICILHIKESELISGEKN